MMVRATLPATRIRFPLTRPSVARKRVFAWWCTAALLLWASGCHGGEQWDKYRAVLPSVKTVSGRSVGFEGQPGMFFKLSEAMIRTGVSDRQMAELLENDAPAVRCMGLVVVAQTKKRQAAPVLRGYLTDRDVVLCFDLGCS